MELVVLGASASFPAVGGACSGYLVRQGDTQLLLDCGSGVLARLQQETRIAALSAIVITHFHPDHYIDLIAMRYGLQYGFDDPGRPLLYLPPGGIAFLERLGLALRNSATYFSKTFEMAEFDPDNPLVVGDFTLAFQQTTHDQPTWACAVHGEARLVYTSDTRESPAIEEFAGDADLLLCEATYPSDCGKLPSGNHLTSRQAGELARRGGAKRLVLTHFWPGIALSRFRTEAEATFGAPVILAQPGMRLAVVPEDSPIAA